LLRNLNNPIGNSVVLLGVLLATSLPAAAHLKLGPERLVQAGGVEIAVSGYSVPAFAYWDGDGLKDLIVGEGGGSGDAKVRVYLNVGSPGAPEFDDYFYAQSDGGDLAVPAAGCLGVFPRVVYWDADDRKDLLAGLADGRVMIFLNVGTDDEPVFDAGTFLQVGEPGAKVDIDVGARACCTVADWNNDGRKDLVVGALDGKIHIFLNEGTDTEPDFRSEQFAQEDGADLVVPSLRSSPVIRDLDDDGNKYLLTGNTEGQLLFYTNVGTDADPAFSGCVLVESAGVAIDLEGTPRSRPFVCDWNEDGLPDVLLGAGDGLVRLYENRCAADGDGDGDTDLGDLAALLAAYRCEQGDPNYNPAADFNRDGVVDLEDLAFLLADYRCAT